jgi:hypothetical protein
VSVMKETQDSSMRSWMPRYSVSQDVSIQRLLDMTSRSLNY